MTATSWKTGTTGDWNTGADWSNNAVPGSGDDVTIAASGAYTVAVDHSEAAHSVALKAAGATVAVSGKDVVFSIGTSFSVTSGTLSLTGNATTIDQPRITGGTLVSGTSGIILVNAVPGDTGGDEFDVDSAVSLAGTATIASGAFLELSGGGTLGGSIGGSGVLGLNDLAFTAKAAAFAASLAEMDVQGNASLGLSGSSGTISAYMLLANTGTISIAAGTTITSSNYLQVGVGGPLDYQFESALAGPGSFVTAGGGEVQDAGTGTDMLLLGGGINWTNSGTLTDYGQIAMNTVSADKVTITNSAAGTFMLVGDDANLLTHGSFTDGKDSFVNAGLLQRLPDSGNGSDNGTISFAAAINSTGTIDVETGTLAMTDGGTLNGTLSGAGTLLLYSGTYAIGTLSGNGHLAIGTGATVTYTGSPVISGTYTLDNNEILAVAAGKTLTLSGNFIVGDTSGGGTIEGPGTLVTSGTTTITDLGSTQALSLQSGANWINTGSVTESGVGNYNTPGADGDTDTVLNKGSFTFAGPDAGFGLAANGTDIFANTGTLARTGSGTSILDGTVNSSGTVNVSGGVLQLQRGGGAISGTLSGAGTLALGDTGYTTTGISGSGTLALNNNYGIGTLTGSATGTITDSLQIDGGATLAAAAGTTLTISGPVSIGASTTYTNGGVFSGPGTITTTGTTVIADLRTTQVLSLQSGANWTNTGTVTESGVANYNTPGADGDTDTILNKGSFTFAGPDAGFGLAANGTDTFTNTGTLARTGSGTSILDGIVNSSGTVNVSGGVLQLQRGGGAISGTLSGAGTLALGDIGYTTTGISGSGTLALNNNYGIGTLTATATGTITGSLQIDGGATLAAASGKTLTVSGPVSIGASTAYTNGGVLFGPGTITTSGVTTIADLGATQVLSVEGGTNWINAGSVTDSGVGNYNTPGADGDTDSILNKGSFTFAGPDAGFGLAANGTDTFTNTGTLIRSGTGTSILDGLVNSSKLINVTGGVLQLQRGGGAISGTLSGSGTLALGDTGYTTTGLSGTGTLALNNNYGIGTLTATATGTITGSLQIDGGATLAAASGKTLTVSGPVTIGASTAYTNGGVFSGPGTITTTGTTVIADLRTTQVLSLQSGANWTNTGTVTESGVANYNTPGADGDTDTILNKGSFTFAGPDAGFGLAANGTDAFTNTGTLARTGSGTSILDGIVNSSGTVNVSSGVLQLQRGGGAISGTLSGAGTLALGDFGYTTTGISGSGTLALNNSYGIGTLTATATGTITDSLQIDGGATLAAASGKTLTVSGPVTVGASTIYTNGGVLSGPGTIITSGATSIANLGTTQVLALQGGVTWTNAVTGTVTDGGYGISNGGIIVNAGVFNFSSDFGSLQAASASDSFRNTGTFGKTGGTGSSLVSEAVTSTGTINVATGTLEFTAGGALSGLLSGAGQLDLAAGTFTTTGLSGAGHLAVNGGGTTLTQTATGTIAAALLVNGNGTLAVAPAASILTLSGPVTLGDASSYGNFSGPGTVSTIGTTSIFDDGAGNVAMLLEGGITWADSGTVNDAGYIGIVNDGNAASITNSGTFNLTSDDGGLSGPNSAFGNTGTLAKTSGTGTSTIGVTSFTNTGLISVASGTLALNTNATLGGTLTGTGVLALEYGTFTTTGLAGTGTLAINSALGSYDGAGVSTFTNTANATIADTVIVDGESTIAPAANTTLTFTGHVQLGDAASYAGLIGPGRIATTGTTLLPDLGANVLDATADGGITWANSGTVSLGDVLYLNPSATIDNLASGVFDLTSDDATITAPGGPPVGPISNAGTLAKTGGTGTSIIDAPISNTGTIEAAHGTLSLTGNITGTGHIKIDAGATLDAGTLPASQAIAFNGGAGATLKMEVPASIATLTAFTAGDRLDLVGDTVTAASVSGTTLTVTAGGVKTTYVSAGLAGEVATFGSDKNGGSFVSLFRAASATHTPEPLAFGNHHVGDKNVSLGLTVTNSAPADGYSEKLNASLGGATTGFTGAGTVTALAAGASNSTSLTVAFDTSAAGTKTGTATLSLATNGTGVDGRGTTALTPQTVNLTGADYNYAAASLSSSSITLANHHVGDKPNAFLTLTNTAASGVYSEGLDARFTAASGAATGTGSVSLIAAGASNSTSLSVGLAPTAGGVATGTETLTFISDGAGTSGLGTTTLGTQAVSVTGTFYALAAGTLASSVVAFGNHHVGDTVAAKFQKLTNTAPTGGFSEALDASFTATGAITAAGSVTKLAAGASNTGTLSVGETASAAGTIGGTLVLNLISDGNGIDGLGTTTLLGQTITVTGANYALASGTLASSTINLGVIHASTAASASLSLTNGAPAGGYGESLDAGLSGASGGLSTHGSISLLKAGLKDTSSLSVSVNTATTGQYSGSATLGLISDGAGTSGLGTTSLTSQTVTVTATVDNYAAAAFEDPSGPAITGSSTSATINLGSTLQGNAALSLTLGALNTATGLSDLLAGTISTAGATGFTNTGFGAIGSLSAGADEHAQSISLSTGTAGTFSETVTLSTYGTNASGYKGALTPETLTVTGTITPSVFHTYTLATGPNMIHGADGLGDIFVASAGALNTRDQLTGGSGANSVLLSGAGLFDINAPAMFTNIPTINATEGQAAMGAAADTRQTVLLRDGVVETLNVAAGTAVSGNTNAEAITVYAFGGTDTIALASGADQVFLGTGNSTVTLGGVANSVTAGGGTALVHSTAALAGASVVGTSTGVTTLDITTGGAITLNAADTYLTVQLHAASSLQLSALSFITAIGSSGADTLTALATSQTLTGGAGADILNGYSGGNDSFADTAAGLNGDTINNWTTGDIIDISNIAAANLHPLTFGSNTLTATDGTTSTAIRFAAGEALGNFTVLGADSAGTGVLIGFHT